MGYTGKADDSVIYYSPAYGRYIVRKMAKYSEESNHRSFAQVNRAIFALNPSPEYRSNMQSYLLGYNKLAANKDKPVVVWTNLFSKLMWNMQRIYKVDLAGITRESAYAQSLPCLSIAQAVEAGLLPYVKGAEHLTALL